MAKNLQELSKAEWVVMNACWELGQATARQVYERTSEARQWDYQTVKTMLDRVAEKGYLKRHKLGPLCLYDPAVSHSKVTRLAVQNFVGTVLGNAVAPLFAHLANNNKLTDDDIARLKELIEKHEERRDD